LIISFSLTRSRETLALYRSLDPDCFPATVSAADSLPRPLVEEFHFGLDLILRGVRELQGGAGPK
jgi:hypothetical protein